MGRENKIYPLAEGLTTQDTFAVLGDAQEFLKHRHAWKAWRTLKEFGCVAYAVAGELKRLEGGKVYENVAELKDKVTVAVPCLPPESLPNLVSDVALAGVEKIWFQERTWTPELQKECEEAGIAVIRGCVLKHKEYPAFSLRYFNPCYWHGLREAKVPSKRFL